MREFDLKALRERWAGAVNELEALALLDHLESAEAQIAAYERFVEKVRDIILGTATEQHVRLFRGDNGCDCRACAIDSALAILESALSALDREVTDE